MPIVSIHLHVQEIHRLLNEPGAKRAANRGNT